MPVFALVDANNFYATCEKIFDPTLASRPLVVLSNNDGCIVARSAEAKALGIAMGAPIHQWQDFCRAHGVVIKSSNYALYGDMSARMLAILEKLCPDVESYSIDESFLDLQGFPDITAYGHLIRDRLRQHIKITCGVGIGPTKTLAKLANLVAKKQPEFNGVCNLFDHSAATIDETMARYAAGEVWGIGRQLAPRLSHEGIRTVLDLKHADALAIRRRYGVVVEKIVRELNGDVRLTLEEVGRPKQQIMSTRSFGRELTDPQAIQAALAHHVAQASERLRAQGSVAAHLYVMLRSNPFREQQPPYRRTLLVPLPHPTADTRVLMAAAMQGLRHMLVPGLRYHKCGVMLGEIGPADSQQADLFAAADDPARLRLMAVMDSLNKRQGAGTLFFASTRLSTAWHMRAHHRSPSYTTRWDEFPIAYA